MNRQQFKLLFFNPSNLKRIIKTIREDEMRLGAERKSMDDSSDHEIFRDIDRPFLNRLCLMLLVALRHEIERELIGIKARGGEGGHDIDASRWWEKIREEQIRRNKRTGEIERFKNGNPKPNTFKYGEMIKHYHIDQCRNYMRIEALRQLTNIVKHGVPIHPTEELLKYLGMKTGVNYDELDKSDRFREGLATFIDLGKDADYSKIADHYIDIAYQFIEDVEKKNSGQLSNVNWYRLSLDPPTFLNYE